ncbi:MAG TPA: methionine adenosyltransferase, partial [Gemmatimonadetes bacterium]|nr:methionine adenosyltransferase [Gemmatimonadota bacterium]
RLRLRAPIYTATAAYGHFGRAPEIKFPDAGGDEAQFFPWELTDRVDDLRNALGG